MGNPHNTPSEQSHERKSASERQRAALEVWQEIEDALDLESTPGEIAKVLKHGEEMGKQGLTADEVWDSDDFFKNA